MEHEFSLKSTGFDLFTKETARQESDFFFQEAATFEYCADSKKSSQYIRAIQGHSGGIPIDPELMVYIRNPYNWKNIFHRGCSFSIQSVLENGLIPGGHGSDKGRQTVFCTPLNTSKKNLVMIAQFLKKCTTTVIGNEIKMPRIG